MFSALALSLSFPFSFFPFFLSFPLSLFLSFLSFPHTLFSSSPSLPLSLSPGSPSYILCSRGWRFFPAAWRWGLFPWDSICILSLFVWLTDCLPTSLYIALSQVCVVVGIPPLGVADEKRNFFGKAFQQVGHWDRREKVTGSGRRRDTDILRNVLGDSLRDGQDLAIRSGGNDLIGCKGSTSECPLLTLSRFLHPLC